MLYLEPFPEAFKDGNFLFFAELLDGIKSNALLTMDLFLQFEELIDVHKSLYRRLSMVILLAFWDGIYKVSSYMGFIPVLR